MFGQDMCMVQRGEVQVPRNPEGQVEVVSRRAKGSSAGSWHEGGLPRDHINVTEWSCRPYDSCQAVLKESDEMKDVITMLVQLMLTLNDGMELGAELGGHGKVGEELVRGVRGA